MWGVGLFETFCAETGDVVLAAEGAWGTAIAE
jgi:hypothetical protein